MPRENQAAFSLPAPDVLPIDTFQAAVRFAASRPDDDGDAWCDIPIPTDLARAVPKRRLEYQAGRYCARAALTLLGCPPAIPGRDPSGVPVWPHGVVGSITHVDGFARAAVAWSADAEGIGIDTECVLSAARARVVTDTIADEEEVTAGMRAGLDRCEAITLVFSAKETAFKCLHRLVGRRFGFADMRVVRVDGGDRSFDIETAAALSADFPAGISFRGRFAVDSTLLHTGLLLRAGAAAVRQAP
jgi:enterobactin synthetase component D